MGAERDGDVVGDEVVGGGEAGEERLAEDGDGDFGFE